jgi:two-component system NtrC family sensor kinase
LARAGNCDIIQMLQRISLEAYVVLRRDRRNNRMAEEKVLIIDDSAELRSVLESILPFGGYTVFSAGTASQGLERVEQARPDLILLDLELPDTNGLKFLEELQDRGLTTPTIMMTGYGSEGVAARALRLGVRDYLIKPFTAEEVLSSVERAIAESRLRRDRDRLNSLLSDYARDFRLLGAIGRCVAEGAKLEEALQRIVAAGMYMTRAEAALLIVREGGEYRLKVSDGEASAKKQFALPAGDDRLRPVLEQGTLVRLHSADAADIGLQTEDKVRSVIQVPLKGRGALLGLLSVDRRTTNAPFGKYDEQILLILADYAVIALHRAF